MQEFFQYVFKIKICQHMDKSITMDLVKVLKLFETEQNGFGWPIGDTSTKVVTIEPENLGKVAPLNHRSDTELHKVIDAGAEMCAKSDVYSDLTDAKIQMAFIACKFGVQTSDIEKATNYHLNKTAYLALTTEILQEFPEKLL